MRKNVFGRRFKRDKNERKALFKSLITALVLSDKIETTEEKAKSIKGTIDKLINKVKKNHVQVNKVTARYLAPIAVDAFVNQVVPSFTTRTSGYTRIIKKGRRLTDKAKMVVMEWVEREEPVKVEKEKKEKQPEKKEEPAKKVAKKAKK
ncbi:MAG: 50S ribosomal protein L17 [Candidatus Levybacteria bacterium]|nr:50S ribosomal protein L17 [Candidatus Levybacteria bacterium]